jgi:hypothetical protein
MFLTLFQFFTIGQVKQTIDIRFLTAKFSDTSTTKNLDVVFLITTSDTIDFPPIVNLPPKCTVFENGREKVLLLAPQNLGISFSGRDVASKDKKVYNLIKDIIDLKSLVDKKTILICYSIKDLNFVFKKMSLTPSFKEKLHKEIIVDKRVEFDVK